MKLEYAPFRELEDAKARRVPLIIPVGTIEYHGPHCSLGCDTQIAVDIADRLAERKELVTAPPIWYGVASYAVAGPEKNTVQIDVDVFEQYVACLLTSLLEGGWRNIYLLIHHQYEEESLMPMTLACMKAGKKVTMAFLEKSRGNAWWGDNQNAAYYNQLDSGDNPFNWITTLPCMSTRAQQETGYDHAGEWECSLLMALEPEAVNLSRLPESDEWFIQSAAVASAEKGMEMLGISLDDLAKRIT
ncbi:MAG: creatininase family protein [Oscillospiraceae bacterium]